MKKFRYSRYVAFGNEGYPGTEAGYSTTTKIYAVLPRKACEAIARAENWDGCHWDAPELIYHEQIPGTEMSDTALTIIHALDAEKEEIERDGRIWATLGFQKA